MFLDPMANEETKVHLCRIVSVICSAFLLGGLWYSYMQRLQRWKDSELTVTD